MFSGRGRLFRFRPAWHWAAFCRLAPTVLFAILAFGPGVSRIGATAANGQPAKFIQPDGIEIQLRSAGDEWFHWHETTNGYVVLQDGDGFWKYARPESQFFLQSNVDLPANAETRSNGARLQAIPGAIVGRVSPASLGLRKRELPDVNAIRSKIRRLRGPAAPSKTDSNPLVSKSSLSAQSAVSFGKRKVRCIVLLAAFSDQWDDQKGTVSARYGFPRESYDSLCNESGYHFDGAKGSVRDFYLENSYDQLTIDFVVANWVRLPHEESWYGDNANESEGEGRSRQMVIDAINAASAAGFDFSQGDGDEDGYIDLLHVFHSGYAEDFNGNPSTELWTREWWMADGPMLENGVGITTFSYSSALRGSSSAATAAVARIGFACHELGHQFGLPDLYDIALGNTGVGTWCAMGYGNWGALPGGDGVQPVHFSARCKQLLGFVTPESMHGQGQVSIQRVEDHPEIQLVRDGSQDEHEYFLIENRQPTGFDSELPGGLLIWHIRDDIFENDSSYYPHPAVRLEEAGGEDELEDGYYAKASQVWRLGSGLPGGFRDQTGSDTSNAMNYQDGSLYYRVDDPGAYTRIRLSNFSLSAPTMTYHLQTVVPALSIASNSAASLTIQWTPASDATVYELQKGSVITSTDFADGAESPDTAFEEWKITGIARRSFEDSNTGSYSYMLATHDEWDDANFSRAQSMELRRSFVVTERFNLSFWAKSHIASGHGYLRAEISPDNGTTWMTLAELSGYVDPWQMTTVDASIPRNLGIVPGTICRLRFLARIQDIWGWGGYPRYGFAIDDIAVTGVQTPGEGNWKTIVTGLTGTVLDLGSKPPGEYAYRVRAQVNGEWQHYSPAATVSVLSDFAVWAQNLPEGEQSETADPDHDGVINLMEYALGRNGNSPSQDDGQDQLPIGVLQNGLDSGFVFEVNLPESPPADISYGIFAATELDGPWTLLASKQGSATWTGDTAISSAVPVIGRQVHSFIEPTGANSHRFFQLRVSRGALSD
jgi:M6 family metalloprotease-like protein